MLDPLSPSRQPKHVSLTTSQRPSEQFSGHGVEQFFPDSPLVESDTKQRRFKQQMYIQYFQYV